MSSLLPFDSIKPVLINSSNIWMLGIFVPVKPHCQFPSSANRLSAIAHACRLFSKSMVFQFLSILPNSGKVGWNVERFIRANPPLMSSDWWPSNASHLVCNQIDLPSAPVWPSNDHWKVAELSSVLTVQWFHQPFFGKKVDSTSHRSVRNCSHCVLFLAC